MFKDHVQKYIYPFVKEQTDKRKCINADELLKLYKDTIFGSFFDTLRFFRFDFSNIIYYYGVKIESPSSFPHLSFPLEKGSVISSRADWFIYLFQLSIVSWIMANYTIRIDGGEMGNLKPLLNNLTRQGMENFQRCFYSHLFGKHKIDESLPKITWPYPCSDSQVYCPSFIKPYSLESLKSYNLDQTVAIANSMKIDILNPVKMGYNPFGRNHPSLETEALKKGASPEVIKIIQRVSNRVSINFPNDTTEDTTKNGIMLFQRIVEKKFHNVLAKTRCIDVKEASTIFYQTPIVVGVPGISSTIFEMEDFGESLDVGDNEESEYESYKDIYSKFLIDRNFTLDEFVKKNQDWIEMQLIACIPFSFSIQSYIKGDEYRNTNAFCRKDDTFGMTKPVLNMLNLFSYVRSPPSQIIVHRTLERNSTTDKFKIHRGSTHSKTIYTENGFMSASLALQKKIQKRSPTSKNLVYISLVVPFSTICLNLLPFNFDEAEILFPPGVKYYFFEKRNIKFRNGHVAPYYLGVICGFEPNNETETEDRVWF